MNKTVIGSPAGEQRLDRSACLLSDLELNRATRLLLDDGGSIPNASPGTNVINAQANEIGRSQLAVDAQIEQGEVTERARHSSLTRIDQTCFGSKKGAFLTDEDALVPRSLQGVRRLVLDDIHGGIIDPPPLPSLPTSEQA